MAADFHFPVTVRYLEVDQQGVVFNAWYLVWFDEAVTAYLAASGLPYAELRALGADIQVVHTEISWSGPVGYEDEVTVQVATAHVGRTSVTLDFVVRRRGEQVAWARTIYVVVGVDGSGKREVPEALRSALGEPRPLKPQGHAPRRDVPVRPV